MRFFPEPGELSLGMEKGVPSLQWGKMPGGGGSTRSHPVVLYLKAHLLNRKVIQARRVQKGFALSFDGPFGDEPGVGEWEVQLAASPHELVHRFRIPGRAPFEKTIRLGKLERAGATNSDVKVGPESAETPLAPEAKKHARLLKNIEADRTEAEQALAWLRPLCAVLEREPQAWGGELPNELLAVVQREISNERLPAFSASTRKSALETLFRLKRRHERKFQAAAERLSKVQRRGPLEVARKNEITGSSGEAASSKGADFPKRKPGLWVQLAEQLWARVGRSASENGELFRQARDRDLWFHVRGATGAHVWVPRGQKGFGARDEPGSELVRWGCQLALLNSDAARAGWAIVDYTERRYLKKLRGQEGAVEILRSDTRRTTVDKSLEKKWFK